LTCPYVSVEVRIPDLYQLLSLLYRVKIGEKLQGWRYEAVEIPAEEVEDYAGSMRR
jgi:hypothetical protein